MTYQKFYKNLYFERSRYAGITESIKQNDTIDRNCVTAL